MHKEFNVYTNELSQIIEILNSFPPIFNITAKELRKYQCLISRKEFLQKKINNLLNKRANIIGKYNDKNRLWLESSMNCRKYCKLEQSAAYSRDKKLYKLGFLNFKPTLPICTNVKTFFKEKFFQPISNNFSNFRKKAHSYFESISNKSPILKSVKKTKNFFQEELPKSLTNFAISKAKKCIISYRKFTNSLDGSLHNFSRSISTTPTIKTLSYIINTAKLEADIEENPFLSRIRVNPNTNDYYNHSVAKNGYYGTGKVTAQPVTKTQSNLRISKSLTDTSSQNFDLAL